MMKNLKEINFRGNDEICNDHLGILYLLENNMKLHVWLDENDENEQLLKNRNFKDTDDACHRVHFVEFKNRRNATQEMQDIIVLDTKMNESDSVEKVYETLDCILQSDELDISEIIEDMDASITAETLVNKSKNDQEVSNNALKDLEQLDELLKSLE